MTAGSNIGAFDLRGRRRADLDVGGGGSSPPSPVKLWKLALDAGAKHVWGGEDGALPDIVGGVDLVRGSGQATPSNPALDAFWSGGAQSTNIGANTGAQNVTLNKGADRSWMLTCYPTSAPSGTRALLALGAYTDADGLGTLTITTSLVRWLDRNWTTDAGVILFNPAGHYQRALVLLRAVGRGLPHPHDLLAHRERRRGLRHTPRRRRGRRRLPGLDRRRRLQHLDPGAPLHVERSCSC